MLQKTLLESNGMMLYREMEISNDEDIREVFVTYFNFINIGPIELYVRFHIILDEIYHCVKLLLNVFSQPRLFTMFTTTLFTIIYLLYVVPNHIIYYPPSTLFTIQQYYLLSNHLEFPINNNHHYHLFIIHSSSFIQLSYQPI